MPDFATLKPVDIQPDFSTLKPANPTIPTDVQQRPESTGLFADAFKTLIVKPAIRLGQAIGTPIAKALGASDQAIANTANAPVEMPFGSSKITVEPQKALGQGGGTQIAADALKSGAYLAPYGKVAGGLAADATELGAGKIASRLIGGAGAGAIGGYTADVSNHLEKQGIQPSSFTPGFATLLGGLTGGALEGAGVGIEKLSRSAQGLGKELEQQSFKLTPVQKSKLGTRLDELTKFSADNIPAGTAEQRFHYADDLYQHYEEKLQSFLEQTKTDTKTIDFKTGQPKVAPAFTVNKNSFIKSLQAIKGEYKYDRDSVAISKQIDGAIEAIQNTYKGDAIPADKLNIFKRSTYQNAYNKAGDKVADFVEHDIADKARLAIEKATKNGTIDGKSIGEFNREYGDLIQIKKLLKIAQGRPELGFTKRIVSRFIGGLIGHAFGGLPGLVAGEMIAEPVASGLAGTAVKTGLARKLINVQPKRVGSVLQRLSR